MWLLLSVRLTRRLLNCRVGLSRCSIRKFRGGRFCVGLLVGRCAPLLALVFQRGRVRIDAAIAVASSCNPANNSVALWLLSSSIRLHQ